MLKQLICYKEKRLKTAAEIKAHPFFKSIDWAKLHERTAPFIPKLANDEDVSNFIEFNGETDELGNSIAKASASRDRAYAASQLNFIGFSHCKKSNINEVIASKETLQSLKANVTQADPLTEAKL